MGWSPGDEAKVAQSKMDLSKAKSSLYALSRSLNNIQHTEKRNALMSEYNKICDALTAIEMHLNR